MGMTTGEQRWLLVRHQYDADDRHSSGAVIIFMVIVPVTPKGLDALVPQPPKNPQQEQKQTDRTIVVQILHRRRGRRRTRSTRPTSKGASCCPG